MTLTAFLTEFLGDDLPVGLRTYDGDVLGPPDPPATIVIRSRDALRRIVLGPRGELGFVRAFVAGDLDVEGDLLAALRLRDRIPHVRLSFRQRLAALRFLRLADLRPLPPPPEEIRLRGRLHSRQRDAEAIHHHYDVSNDFYELLLGPAMLYSCGVFEHPDDDLERVQNKKIDLVCRKLGLLPGMRVLDAGCGWGTFAIHAARNYGVNVVGVTLSSEQVEYVRKRVADAGVADRVEVRLQDYRDIDDGPYDAAACIGMLEHIGRDLDVYAAKMHDVLRPGGRFAHHAISLPPPKAGLSPRPTFISRYVFPDGDLCEIGAIITAFQRAGFEARHMETIRDHYPLTLRLWLARLDEHWDEAVASIGLGRARVWKLYMTGSILAFEENRLQIHHVTCVRPPESGESGMSLRPDWE